MSKIIVVGHKNPDTDSALAAVMLSELLKKEDKDAVPKIAGDANKETEFIFNFLKEKIPEKIESVSKADSVFLVDHNELAQSIAKKENIYGVLDHHALSGLKTDKAIYFRVEPLGSTCTLIYKIMKERGIKPCTKEAALLLAGIVSDTLNLNSSTTTTEDIDSLYELSQISKIGSEEFAEKMFEAKSDLTGRSIESIVEEDLKIYEMEGKKIGIGVFETASLVQFKEKEEEVFEQLKKTKENQSLNALFFGVIDIINAITYLYPVHKEEETVIKEKFKGEKKDGFYKLENTSSRKKEILPPISEFYNSK